MNDRFKFRTPIYGAEGNFKRFVYWNAADGFPAITARKGEVFKEPEQCTGIKDKNRRLVYEGDILSEKETGEKGAVCWNKKVSCWCYKNRKGGYTFTLNTLAIDFFEVIGNIHDKLIY